MLPTKGSRICELGGNRGILRLARSLVKIRFPIGLAAPRKCGMQEKKRPQESAPPTALQPFSSSALAPC